MRFFGASLLGLLTDAREETCTARLFSDGALNAATQHHSARIEEGFHNLQSLKLEDTTTKKSVPLAILGITSVIVAGPGRCVLTLFENPNYRGWQVQLPQGRYTRCNLQAHGAPGIPVRASGALLQKLPGAPSNVRIGTIVNVPQTIEKRGIGRMAGLSTFRHFALDFSLKLPKKGCAGLNPFLEIISAGYTSRGEYFNVSNPAAINLMATSAQEFSTEEYEAWLRRPLLQLTLLPSLYRHPQTCSIGVVLETLNFPNSRLLECFGSEISTDGPPLEVKILFGSDNVLVVSIGDRVYAKCESQSSSPAQQHNDVYLGSQIYNTGLPSGSKISNIRYRLVGPLGPYQVYFPSPSPELMGFIQPIPRVIHQVWLGPNEPVMLTGSWRAYALFNTGGWEHRVWRSEDEIKGAIFGPSTTDPLVRALWPLYDQEDSRAGRSDFLRWVLLYIFGGVYVDADALWLGPGPGSKFDDHLENASFVAAWEDKRELLVATGTLASVPRSAVTRRMLEEQIQLYTHCRVDLEAKPWDALALGVLTRVLTSEFISTDSSVRILPSKVFYAIDHHKNPWHRSRDLLWTHHFPESVSVDFGFSTNGLDPRDFMTGWPKDSSKSIPSESMMVSPPPHDQEEDDTYRGLLMAAWQSALVVDPAEVHAAPIGGQSVERFSRLHGFPRTTELRKGHVEQLMIVAHADDESLFGGELLLSGPLWGLVVVGLPADAKQRREREAELAAAMQKPFVQVGWVHHLGFPECSLCIPFHPSIYDDLRAVLARSAWTRIVTHGPFGEYGHLQHRELSIVISAILNGMENDSPPLWAFAPQPRAAVEQKTPSTETRAAQSSNRNELLSIYASQQHVLREFKDLIPGAVLLTDFDQSQGREFCRQFAPHQLYYERTCEETSLKSLGPLNLQFLRWEAHAWTLGQISSELAGTIDVGLYASTSLRRLVLGKAWLSAWLPHPFVPPAKWQGPPAVKRERALLGCALSSATAWAWLQLDPRNKAALLAPGSDLKAMGSLQDVSGGQLLWQSPHASQLVNLTSGFMESCGFLMGPAAAVVRALITGVASHRKWGWRGGLAMYGELGDWPDIAIPEDLRIVADANELLLTKIEDMLHKKGWTVHHNQSACGIDDGHVRIWRSRSRERVQDVSVRQATAVQRFGCWVEVWRQRR